MHVYFYKNVAKSNTYILVYIIIYINITYIDIQITAFIYLMLFSYVGQGKYWQGKSEPHPFTFHLIFTFK